MDDYVAARLKQNAARQTINNELSALRRGFRLAIEKGLLAVMPVFSLPKIRRAGVSEGEIMRLCSWETRSMFDRYNIIDEADLASAVANRFNGKVTAKSEGFVEQVS